jgi:N-acetylneuraminate synthase
MSFELNGTHVGKDRPAYIIAEGCDNHLGDLGAAKEMVRQAKLAGANAIKFQHHLPDEEMLPNAPMSDNFDEPLYDFLKKYALTLEQHGALKKFCEQTGITYLCTPFSWKAAQELNGIGVSGFKIGSGEMTDIPTLQRIAEFGKPMIVSTGMATPRGGVLAGVDLGHHPRGVRAVLEERLVQPELRSSERGPDR